MAVLDQLPDAPQRGTAPSVFALAADTFLRALVVFCTQLRALIPTILAAYGYAQDAANSATTAAASSQNVGSWTNYGANALTAGKSVNHLGYTWSLNNNLANVALQEPGINNANWTCLNPGNAFATLSGAQTFGAL